MASQITFIGSRNSESKDPAFYLAELSKLSLYYFDGVVQPSARRVNQDGEEFRNDAFAIELVERRSRLAYVVSEVVAISMPFSWKLYVSDGSQRRRAMHNLHEMAKVFHFTEAFALPMPDPLIGNEVFNMVYGGVGYAAIEQRILDNLSRYLADSSISDEAFFRLSHISRIPCLQTSRSGLYPRPHAQSITSGSESGTTPAFSNTNLATSSLSGS